MQPEFDRSVTIGRRAVPRSYTCPTDEPFLPAGSHRMSQQALYPPSPRHHKACGLDTWEPPRHPVPISQAPENPLP